jgi:hypothetical protein
VEYILRDTDILDEQLESLFNREIITNPGCFVPGRIYRLAVSFNVNLLRDGGFEKFPIPIPGKTARKPEDKIYDVLKYQLHALEQRVADNGVEVHSAVIQGEMLEEERVVRIEMTEEDAAPGYKGKGKKSKQRKVFSIVPDRHYISSLAAEMAGKDLGKIYWDIMNVVKDKKLMSSVLGIEETQNDEILIRAFLEQYGELWLATGEKREELLYLSAAAIKCRKVAV